MSGTLQIDELVMRLVEMGFELEDCHLAIQNGKLSIDQAVEWLLSGKPVVDSQPPPKLKLCLPSQQPPLQQQSPLQQQPPLQQQQPMQHQTVQQDIQQPSQMESSSREACGSSNPCPMESHASVENSGSSLTSRLHMNDQQRQWKLQFEEKQREEAKRLAHQDKQAKKKAHEQALRQIQEDREAVLIRKVPLGSRPAPEGSQTVPQNPRITGSTSASATHSDPDTCLLQIRLIDSRVVKQTFATETRLISVKQFAEKLSPENIEINLIQPFPRVEYNDEHMSMSLRELGLFPNGSLVVNKKDNSAHIRQDSVVDPTSDRSPPDGAPNDAQQPSANPPVLQHPPNIPAPSHSWGAGHNLNEDDSNQMDQQEDAVENIDEDSDDDNIPPGGQVLNPHPNPIFGGVNHNQGHVMGGGGGPAMGGGGVPPMWGGGGPAIGGFGGPPMWGGGGGLNAHGGHNHIWGEGQSLVGQVFGDPDLTHHQKDPKQLAADAAKQRYGTAKPAIISTSEDCMVPESVVPMLREIIVKYVSRHVCSTRTPIVGLQGLPAELASRILENLIKEGLLKPRTLQIFVSCHLNTIVLDCYPYCTNDLLAVLRHHSYLKRLSLQSCTLITERGLHSLTGLKMLEVLNLGSCQQITDNIVPSLIALKSLVTLVLENTSITDSGMIEYANSAPPNLQCLNLSRTSITQAILISLKAMPSLMKLNLEQSKVIGLTGIESLTKLVMLSVSNTAIVTDSLLCLRGHPSLKSVSVSNTPIVNGDIALGYISGLQLTHLQLPNRMTTTDVGILHIAHMPLGSLDLTNYIYITDTSLAYVGQIKMLTKLSLNNTKVTDAGMFFLEGLKNLEELHLDRTLITDVGAAVIKAFIHLKELSLSYTGISNNFLLAGTLDLCVALTKLNISRTRISSKGVLRLRLPNLVMLNIDETFVRPDRIESLPSCPSLEKIIYRTLLMPENEDELD